MNTTSGETNKFDSILGIVPETSRQVQVPSAVN